MNAAREIRRLRYLQAMGVATCVARRALPGAAPSRRLVLRARPAAQPPGAVQTGAEDARAAAGVPAATQAATIREALRSPGTPPPAAAARAAASAAPHAPKTHASRFSLAAMLCAERLWVEELDEGLLASEQVQLVAAMARALVHPEPLVGTPVVTQFSWPMHGNQQLDLGPEEAAASLQGFLLRQLEENSCVELICLGEGAAERARGLRLPCAMRRLPATRTVLANPVSKRELWVALRA